MLTGDQFTGLPESSGSNEMIFTADDAPLTVLFFSSDIESRRRWILSPDCFVTSRSGVEVTILFALQQFIWRSFDF